MNKKTIKSILLIYFTFSLFIVVNLYAAFNWSGQNDDANTTANDTWSITGSVTSIPSSDPLYTSIGKRGEISINSIESTLFGDFSTGTLILYDSTRTECGAGTTYDLSTSFQIDSVFWGNMILDNINSYYCPSINQLVINFYSGSLGNKGINESFSLLKIFNATEVSIKGLADIKGNIENLSSSVSNNYILNLPTFSVDGKLFNLNKTVNKNIALITKKLIGKTGNTPISNFNNTSSIDKYYYYNYEGLTGPNNNLGNEGQTLKIENNLFFNSSLATGYQVSVKGKNTLIVKGGNVYINADIYNEDYSTGGDKNNLLVIVAKRDSTNIQNGGNIYVNPDVTNIDAILIAEGSLLSYDGANVLNAKVDPTLLRRQLLIHGSIMTKNTIGEDIAVYGTDEYIPTGSGVASEYYNLANLRTSNLAYASYNGSDVCGGNDTFIVINDSLGEAIEYAFAGKRECFYDDSVQLSSNLRTIENKLNPLVIEYNPNIQQIKPFILMDN